MPDYRRYYIPDAMVFFTVVTQDRRPLFEEEMARRCLRQALVEIQQKRPFTIEAMVLLPDHLHTIWTLPVADMDFSARWRQIKGRFTTLYLAAGGKDGTRSRSRVKRKERALWQRRFWDHVLRDETDFERHFDYIHYNPVKHGLAKAPRDWSYSTFLRWVEHGVYEANWGSNELKFDDLDETAME